MLSSLLVVLSALISAPQQAAPVAPRPWKHESADLPPNPRIHFGSLSNGLRYAWVDHPVPAGRLYLRLHLCAGSLVEEESELGMAHLVEHLAVEGARSGPQGAYLGSLEQRGLWFAGDQNAFTSRRSTLYTLDLPASDAGTLRQGLGALRSIAEGAAFDAGLIAATERIVAAEERLRVNEDSGMEQARIAGQLAGARIAARDPMGTSASRAGFTPESLRAFYRRWYRPDLFTLVFAGDLGGFDPGPLIQDVLGEIAVPASPAPALPEPGEPRWDERTWCAPVARVSNVWILLERVRAREHAEATRARLIADAPLVAARTLLGERIDELARAHPDALVSGLVEDAGGALGAQSGERLALTATTGRWREALALGERELRRTLQQGFEGSEVERHRALVLQSFDRMVAQESTRSSAELADDLVLTAEGRIVPISAATLRHVLGPVIGKLDAATCSAALRKAWSDGVERAGLVGALPGGTDCTQAMRSALEASRSVEIEARAEKGPAPFAYRSEPPGPDESPPIVAREQDEQTGVLRLRFENGVGLRLKESRSAPGEILLYVRLAGGRAAAPAEQGACMWLAPQMLMHGGLEAHDDDDLARICAGRSVGFGLRVEDDHLGLELSTHPEDLLLALEIACAYVQHPGWRVSGLDALRKQLGRFYGNLQGALDGPLRSVWRTELRNGDLRFGIPPQGRVAALEMSALREWLEPLLREAPLELVVVGDFEADVLINAAARTFARLPERKAQIQSYPLTGLRSGLERTFQAPKPPPAALVCVVWPLHAGSVPSREALQCLTAILQARLSARLREELQAAYDPRVHLERTPAGLQGTCLWLEVDTQVARAAEVREVCLALGQDLAESGPLRSELELARARLLPAEREALASNRGWKDVLVRSVVDAHALIDHERRVITMETVGVEELAELARDVLARESASTAVVRPAGR